MHDLQWTKLSLWLHEMLWLWSPTKWKILFLQRQIHLWGWLQGVLKHRFYHNNHFSLFQKNEKNCHDCGEVIKGPYYTVNSEKVICEKDYKVNNVGGFETVLNYLYNRGGEGVEVEPSCSYQIFFQKQLGKCNKCRRIVDGKVLRVSEDAVYHPECFTCTVSQSHVYKLDINIKLYVWRCVIEVWWS